ncbi:MAG TPA: lyase family protein, partial [Smithella sp.]|nr:lyase family protein [Smithella sp.]
MVMTKKPWGGRFKKTTAASVEKFTASIGFDKRLYPYDIQGSIAHAAMLAQQSIISKKEASKIIGALKSILKDMEKGKFKFSISDEDIHMAIEKEL